MASPVVTTVAAPKDEWDLIEKLLATDIHRPLLYGPPATGKTSAAFKAAREKDGGKEPVQITLTEETPLALMFGFFEPQKEGGLKWHDGDAVRAIREGRTLILNEVGRASSAIHSFLLNVLDDRELLSIYLPTGEIVKPAPGFRVIATTNDDPETFTDALRDRFTVKVYVRSPNPDVLRRLPKNIAKAVLEGYYEVAKGKDFAEIISVRQALDFVTLSEKIGQMYAARACFGARAADCLAAMKLA
jgi:MoxR-like ATPase